MRACRRILGLTASLALILAARPAAATRPAAAAWPTDPLINLPVCVASGDQGPPRAVTDGADGIVTAWLDQRAGGQIFAQRVSASGAALWTPDGNALGPAGATSDPMIAEGGAGGAVIAWVEDSGSARALKAQRLDGDGIAQWAPGGVTLRARVDQPNFPNDSNWLWDQFTGVSDGAGGMFVCFQERHQEDNALDPSRYSSQLLLVHCDGTGAVVDERVLASDEYICSFCGDGYFHLDDFSQLTTAQGAPAGLVVAFRARPIINHGTHFQPPEIRVQEPIAGLSAAVVTAAIDVRHPRVATDGAGGAIASWEDTRSGGPHLYAARLTAANAQPWSLGGVPVSGGAGDQLNQEMISTADGGVALVWLDRRNSSVPDVYAQRLDGLGAPQWSGDVALATQPTLETDLAPALTANGTVAFAWRDTRSGSGDVFARFVSPAGTAYGSVDGDAVTDASGDQAAPSVVASGTQAIVTWMDRRSGTSADVYAQRIGLGGPVSGVGDGEPAATLRMEPFVPNPTTGSAIVRFALSSEGEARVRVFDLAGRLVRVLERSRMAVGPHEVRWDGRDDRGRPIRSGLYLVVLEAQGRRLTGRLAIVR